MNKLRYEPEERCPVSVAIVSALQIFLPNTVSVIMLATLVVRASGQSDDYLSWVMFTALASCGLGTIWHACRFRHAGSGRVVVTNFNVPYLAVCTLALDISGPRMLAILMVVSTLLQFVLTRWLASLRRIITPAVNGAVVMLVAVSAVPFIISNTVVTPKDVSAVVFLAPGAVALTAGVVVSLRGSALLRMWILPIMVTAGLVAAVPLGFYDFSVVTQAPLVSLPLGEWPGLDSSFSGEFWTLLPAFVIVNLTAFIKSVGDLSVIYRGSYRNPVAVDYRTVQGGLNVYGFSTLLSGLLAIPPVAAPWAVTVVYVSFIGVAARSVGMYLGLATLAAAPISKLIAVLTAIPSPVVSAVYIMIFGMLFIEGAKTAFVGRVDQKKATVVGVSMVLGLSAGSFGGLVSGTTSMLISSSIVVGALTAIAMTTFSELSGFRNRRLQIELARSSVPAVDDFFSQFADRHDWTEQGKNRLRLVGEEIMLNLLNEEHADSPNIHNQTDDEHRKRKLTVDIRLEGSTARLEIVVASDDDMGGNLEDRLAYLEEEPAANGDLEFSVRLLRHYASSLHHRKYHGVDIITCRVQRHQPPSTTG